MVFVFLVCFAYVGFLLGQPARCSGAPPPSHVARQGYRRAAEGASGGLGTLPPNLSRPASVTKPLSGVHTLRLRCHLELAGVSYI